MPSRTLGAFSTATITQVHGMKSWLAVVVVMCGMWVAVRLEAGTTTLSISKIAPTTPDIDSNDVVQLRALTPVNVFSSSAWGVSSTVTINDFNIYWTIVSYPTGGNGATVVMPMAHTKSFGALPAGSYHVDATWSHLGGNTIPGAPTSGSGTFDFLVQAAAGYAGDYDVDGDVDGADVAKWQQLLGIQPSGRSRRKSRRP